ncbi:MAG: TULIP family P47-like protein [Caldilineaceae bacterium]
MSNINIDLFGWDTAFGISFDQVNKSIAQQKSTPRDFSQGDAGAAGSIAGTWSNWSFTLNGDGKNINIKCPIESGDYYAMLPDNEGKKVDLGSNGANWFEVQIRLEAFDSSQKWYDNTAVKDSGQVKEYKVKSAGGTPESPIASIYATSFADSQAPFNTLKDAEAELAICKAKFTDYFEANLDKFNNIFSCFTLNAKADNGNFQWLKPTITDYAVETTKQMDTSIFSVLCMTENRPAPSSGEATDPRLLQAANSPSIFAMAQKRFLEKWLMPGVVLANTGTSQDDYFMYSDTLIVNNKDLVFKNRVENHAKNPVDLKVPTGNFKIGVFDTQMFVRFEGASFEYADGITCELNYVDYYKLSLLPGDGHNALHVTPVDKLPDIQMSMQVADWRQKRDSWVEIGVSVGVSVSGAALGPDAWTW